jgi:hypothetical protein
VEFKCKIEMVIWHNRLYASSQPSISKDRKGSKDGVIKSIWNYVIVDNFITVIDYNI